MPLYRFTSIAEDGRTLKGQLEAASEQALEAVLRKQGQWLASARELNPMALRPTAQRPRIGNVKVPRRVLIQLFLSLHLQLKAGVNLLTALTFALDADGHAGYRGVHLDVLERVKAGEPLSEAMAAHPRTYPTLAVHLIRAGEASGRMTESCEEIRRHLEWSDRLLADIRQALFYPVAVLVAVAILFFVVFTFFIPRFTAVLKEIAVPLPALTVFMMSVSGFMKEHWPGILVTLALAAGSWQAGLRFSPGFARAIDRFKLRLPVFGQIIRQICLSRFIQNLAVLYRGGVPLLETLRLSRSIIGNRVIEESVLRIEEGVRAGRPLNESMGLDPIFPPLVVQMTSLGELTGTLDESLQSAANYYDVMVPRDVKKLFALFEPFIIICLVAMVGVVALSIFLPIASVLEAR